MKIQIPKDVKEIIDDIYLYGKEAFIVGGCVRDSIIGLKPNDYDITTSAKPKEVLEIFKESKIIETGIKHGTVTLIKSKSEYEITTYRIDGEYNDNRRPDYVEFTKDITRDLQRRDFTINAMAYNHKIGLVDEFGGIKDINKKIIRTVGIAEERFNEDSLRIIRAVRFSSKLNFEIEKSTLDGIYKNMKLIKNVSVERIQQELSKILISDNPEKIYILYDAGLFKYIGFENIKINECDLIKLKNSKNDIVIRLTILIYLISNDKEGLNLLEILKYPNKVKERCNILLNGINDNIQEDSLNIKIYLNKIGKDNLNDIIYTKNILKKDLKDSKGNIHDYEIIKIIKDIEEKKECYTLRDLKISGKDLKNMNYKGKDIGIKLEKLLYKVMENPKLNENNTLKNLVKYI